MRASLARVGTCVVIFWFIVIAASAASWPQSQAPGTPSSTLVTVDFRVVTRDGTPIRDLRPEEVTLKVGRRPREIVAMQLVQVRASAETRATSSISAATAPFVTNAAATAGGRDVVIVIDDEGIQASRAKRVADLLTSLLDGFSPVDRIGWMVPGNARARVQLTTRHDVVREAIASLTGRALSTETEMETICRTRRNLDALLSVFQNVVPSIPSVVVFVSNGFSPPTVVETVARRGEGPAGPCEIMPRDVDDLTSAAAASRAHVFGIEVIDDTVSGAARSGDLSGGFEHVAGLSGNPVIRLTGNELPAVQRIATETSAYYVAAFQVTPEEQNGSSQRVEVSVARPDATVRAWPTVVMPKAGPRDAKAAPMKLRDLLSASRVFRDVPFRAAVHTSRASADGRLKVVCIFEPSEPGTSLAEAGIALFDDKGTPRAQWTGQRDGLKETPVIVPLNAPAPGTYRLRVAVRDASGAAGTVDHGITVDPPNKAAVTLGALVLGTETKSGFMPLLQFTSEPAALGVVEIYGAPKTATLTAVFELAASETSRALAVLPGTVQAVRDDLRMALMTFQIKDMPPGDVVVRAVVSVDGKPLDARPTRTLRKVQK